MFTRTEKHRFPNGWCIVLNLSLSLFLLEEMIKYIAGPTLSIGQPQVEQTFSILKVDSKGTRMLGEMPKEACFLFKDVIKLKSNP